MRVEASRQATSSDLDFRDEMARANDGAGASTQGRALVVTEAEEAQTASVYRQAPFLAHLIATKDHAPQTRERRRAEPAEAIAAYRTVNALMR